MSTDLVCHASPMTALAASYSHDKYQLLLPETYLQELPCGTKLSARVVRISTRPNDGDVYPTDRGKLALTKTALMRIAAAAHITWVSSRRVDGRSHPHYCEHEVRARVIDFDGLPREVVKTKTLDLRDDCGDGTKGPDLQACKSANQAQKVRQYIDGHCETKAMLRAISDILAIPRSYNPADLQRPFVVPCLIPDSSDPQVKAIMMAQMLGATNLLYGKPEPVAPPQMELPPLLPETTDTAMDPEADLETKRQWIDRIYTAYRETGRDTVAWQRWYREQVGGNVGYSDLTREQLSRLDAALTALAPEAT
jgi:hypothetical protein